MIAIAFIKMLFAIRLLIENLLPNIGAGNLGRNIANLGKKIFIRIRVQSLLILKEILSGMILGGKPCSMFSVTTQDRVLTSHTQWSFKAPLGILLFMSMLENQEYLQFVYVLHRRI